MKIFLVLFQLIFLLKLCYAYMPVYHVANQDLLKGILLGALLTTQKHPPQFLNVMPSPYYSNNYGNPQSGQTYSQSYPTANVEHNQQMHDMEYRDYRDRPSDQSNNNIQQMSGQQQQQQQLQDNESQQQKHSSQSQQQQHQYQHQQAESLFEPSIRDPPPNHSKPQRSEPVGNIPSMETIQKNLGFPGHSVILMILPSFDEKGLPIKEPNKTEITTEMPEPEQYSPEQHSSEQQLITSYDKNLKTNAIKIGSKNLNPKGWKPVPKTTPTPITTTTEENVDYSDNRFNRFNQMNKYIERSQFGLRNKDLNSYYSIDQLHD